MCIMDESRKGTLFAQVDGNYTILQGEKNQAVLSVYRCEEVKKGLPRKDATGPELSFHLDDVPRIICALHRVNNDIKDGKVFLDRNRFPCFREQEEEPFFIGVIDETLSRNKALMTNLSCKSMGLIENSDGIPVFFEQGPLGTKRGLGLGLVLLNSFLTILPTCLDACRQSIFQSRSVEEIMEDHRASNDPEVLHKEAHTIMRLKATCCNCNKVMDVDQLSEASIEDVLEAPATPSPELSDDSSVLMISSSSDEEIPLDKNFNAGNCDSSDSSDSFWIKQDRRYPEFSQIKALQY